jgi:protoporphyrinogen oxidase
MLYTRRQLIRLAGSLSLYIQGCSSISLSGSDWAPSAAAEPFGPVDRSIGTDEPQNFFGDTFQRAHEALWDVPGYLKKNPAPAPQESEYPVVIIGGGVSGLTSAYLLRDLKPLVLEQSSRFGGNSQGQTWRGVPYSIGAAYFLTPDENSPLSGLLKELGVLDAALKVESEALAIVDGKKHDRFFSGSADPASDRMYSKFVKLMERYLSVPQLYPQLPAPLAADRKWVNSLDRLTLRAHLVRELGGKLPAILDDWLEHYCWSSFAASADELSAAAGINFLAAEFGEVRFFPEGNAAIAERILHKLLKSLPDGHLRADCLVLQVSKNARGQWVVVYVDKNRKVQTVLARSVVMACPKFVAAKAIPELEPSRLKAIGSVNYRAYLVANVLIDGKFNGDSYDAFLLSAKHQGLSVEEHSRKAGATDVVVGSYKNSARNCVLTLYRGLPYRAGRSEIFAPSAWNDFRAHTEAQLHSQILPALGIDASRVRGVRMARWGHPMPVPHPGCYRNQLVDKLHAPFRETLFFVHQDNWLLPSLESAMEEALRWTPRIRNAVASSQHIPAIVK